MTSGQLGLLDGEVEKPTPGKSATPAEIRAWWAEVYLPLRAEVTSRWRPDSKIREISCSDRRVAQIRKVLADSCPGVSVYQLGGLTHVVLCAAAKVDAQRGKLVPYRDGTYDTMKNIGPDYWLKPSRFDELLASDAPPPRSEDRRDPGADPYAPRPGMQAHELEREYM